MIEHPEIERPESRLMESGIYVENGFYSKAEILRAEFEKALLGEGKLNAGMTPLGYAYHKDTYQFLTASAERCFSEEAISELIETLQQWGNNVVGASHVSTPQVRVYIRGCSRKLIRDDVTTPWHFLLSLTPNTHPDKSCQIKILRENVPGNSSSRLHRVLSSFPVFNQLLVHSTRELYSIEGVQTSMNPLKGMVFLDGYMW
ncbi:MAG TPA: hypothetical protein VGK21_08515 [Candidatus Angelobacter sp.]|jgi:hypothetical protein